MSISLRFSQVVLFANQIGIDPKQRIQSLAIESGLLAGTLFKTLDGAYLTYRYYPETKSTEWFLVTKGMNVDQVKKNLRKLEADRLEILMEHARQVDSDWINLNAIRDNRRKMCSAPFKIEVQEHEHEVFLEKRAGEINAEIAELLHCLIEG